MRVTLSLYLRQSPGDKIVVSCGGLGKLLLLFIRKIPSVVDRVDVGATYM